MESTWMVWNRHGTQKRLPVKGACTGSVVVRLLFLFVLPIGRFGWGEEVPAVVFDSLADKFQFSQRRAYAVAMILRPGVGNAADFEKNVVYEDSLFVFHVISDLLVPRVEDHVRRR